MFPKEALTAIGVKSADELDVVVRDSELMLRSKTQA